MGEPQGGVLLSERCRGRQSSRSEQRSCERSEQEVRSKIFTRVSESFFSRKFPVLNNQFFPASAGLFSQCPGFISVWFNNIRVNLYNTVFWKVSDLTNDNFLTMKMLYRRVINRMDSGIGARRYYLPDQNCEHKSALRAVLLSQKKSRCLQLNSSEEKISAKSNHRHHMHIKKRVTQYSGIVRDGIASIIIGESL